MGGIVCLHSGVYFFELSVCVCVAALFFSVLPISFDMDTWTDGRKTGWTVRVGSLPD